MKYFGQTNIGLVREKNQDSYLTIFNEDNDFLALVCDGIGGGNAGEVASSECAIFLNHEFRNKHFESEEDVIDFLKVSITNANHYIYNLSLKYLEYSGMGTTLTGLLNCKYGTFVFNVGDSRVYGIKNKIMTQLTEDHSLVNEMIKNKEITYEESLNHPKRHYLTNCIGVYDDCKIDIFNYSDYQNFLICSDGLSGYVSEEDISTIMNKRLKLENKCNSLIQSALNVGGYDNVSVIVVKTNE